jgi:serine/threonine-protein kinase RsbW
LNENNTIRPVKLELNPTKNLPDRDSMNKGFERLKVLKQTHFQVTSDLNALNRVLFHFNQIHQPSIPTQFWLQCQLALVEGFTNAVRHAHKGLASNTPIEIKLTLCTESIEIRIWDCGQPFELEHPIQTASKKQNDLANGGRGLQILAKIADRLRYFRTKDERNCLLIIKLFNPETETLVND